MLTPLTKNFSCFLRRKYGLVTFYGPVVLCTVLNIFLFVRISWSTFSRKSMDTGSMSLSAFEKQKVSELLNVEASRNFTLDLYIFDFFD